jgi:hypothetical protein
MNLTIWRDTAWEVAKFGMTASVAVFVLCLAVRFSAWCIARAWGSICRSWAERHESDDDDEIAHVETDTKTITVKRVHP